MITKFTGCVGPRLLAELELKWENEVSALKRTIPHALPLEQIQMRARKDAFRECYMALRALTQYKAPHRRRYG